MLFTKKTLSAPEQLKDVLEYAGKEAQKAGNVLDPNRCVLTPHCSLCLILSASPLTRRTYEAIKAKRVSRFTDKDDTIHDNVVQIMVCYLTHCLS